jgi:SAM-dependent methyltransferase
MQVLGPMSVTSSPAWRRWPLPALAAWAACWALFLALQPHAGGAPSALAALALAAVLAMRQASRARQLWVLAGFPLSALMSGAALAWPAWVWLIPPLLLVLVYPPRAWRDAPVFPTPPGALVALSARLPLPPGARVLDAGCGAGDGLRALQSAWPAADLAGIEWSWPLVWLARWRCPQAEVRRGDMWRADAWRGLALVYLFQRPESMARAWAKACAEMPGGWLVSLEFAVPGRPADLVCPLPGDRSVLAWRVPAVPVAQPCGGGTDNPR